MYDLNIYPLVHDYDPSWHRLKRTLDLCLTFVPFFLANSLFRILVFSLMFVYLDNWAIIPMIILWVLNLVIFGVSRRSSSSKVTPVSTSNMDMTSYTEEMSILTGGKGTLSEDKRTSENEDMKKKNIFLIPTGKSPTIWNSTTKVPNDRQSSSNQLAKDHTRQDISSTDDLTRDNYNDENTSIFLNATTGIFFPSCHLHLPDLNNTDQNQIQAQTIIDFRIQKITTWQRKFYQVQVYIINTVIMIILTIIFCLVTVSKSFNYNSNIL